MEEGGTHRAVTCLHGGGAGAGEGLLGERVEDQMHASGGGAVGDTPVTHWAKPTGRLAELVQTKEEPRAERVQMGLDEEGSSAGRGPQDAARTQAEV